jgi:hypothetical protein
VNNAKTEADRLQALARAEFNEARQLQSCMSSHMQRTAENCITGLKENADFEAIRRLRQLCDIFLMAHAACSHVVDLSPLTPKPTNAAPARDPSGRRRRSFVERIHRVLRGLLE